MNPAPRFGTLNAVVGAYWSLPAGLRRLLIPLAIWSAIGLAVVPSAGYLLGQVLELSPRVAVLLFFVAAYAETFVLLGASLSISVAWLRWIVLGEENPRVLPRARIAKSYVVPFALFFFLPFMLLPYALDGLLAAWGEKVTTLSYDGLIYGIAVLIPAALARHTLVLAARATEDDSSLRDLLSLTVGSGWPLFWGIMACRLPPSLASVWFSEIAFSFESGTGYVGFYYLSSLFEVIADALTAAFIAFAYLHFTRDRPSSRDPSRHFA